MFQEYLRSSPKVRLVAPVEGFRFSEMNERELFKKEAEHRSPWQQRENEILIQSEIDFR